jgi:hypothetical protein
MHMSLFKRLQTASQSLHDRMSGMEKSGPFSGSNNTIAIHAGPIIFVSAGADADIKSQDTKDLHNQGLVFQTSWLTVHYTTTISPPHAGRLAAARHCVFLAVISQKDFRPRSVHRWMVLARREAASKPKAGRDGDTSGLA